MAKKKGASASLFVPVEEQPYSILENWYWTKLDKIVSIVTGKKDANYGSKNGIYPFFTCAAEPICCNGYSFEGKSLLLPGNGANVGQVTYYDGKFEAYQRTYVLQALNSALNLKYVFYHILGFWENYNRDKQYGSATNYIKMSNFTNYPIVIAPIAEQQRIVDRIESLFAKLDEAKEKAQAVVDGFELRKSAILHKAFTGELTERWRKKHGGSDSDWYAAKFDEVAEIKSNLVDPVDYQDFPHIAPDNIEKRTGILLAYHTVAEDGVKSGKHLFCTGQILYSKIRPYLSKVVIVDFDGLCSADMYPINAKENTRYLWYYMLSDEFLEQASNAGSRSVLPKINQKELSKIIVQMTSLKEQQIIAKLLDNIFAKEQQAKEAAEAVLDQIDTMKKAILARAFRGELGTNDLMEESAVELIENVL